MTAIALRPAPAPRAGISIRRVTTPDRPDDEKALVLSAQRGELGAFSELVRRHQRRAYAVARAIVITHEDAEDAVQDAWVAFTRAAGTIATPMAIGGWLCTTTSRTALAIAQRQARCRPSERPVEGRVAPIDSAAMEANDEQKAVREAVARLSPEDREMVRFLFDAELPYTEIAARTGRAIGGIGPTRQRIITKLRHDRAIHRQYLARTA